MGDPKGFLKVEREKEHDRPIEERKRDWREIDRARAGRTGEVAGVAVHGLRDPVLSPGLPAREPHPRVERPRVSGARSTRPRGAWRETNNFPEVTGRVCPAPCEASCVLNIRDEPVTIKTVERTIADHMFTQMPLAPKLASARTGKRVAVVGSGPAGLAAAQQLARAGHDVTLFERDDRIGGLLRYGIPDFKMEKGIIDARIEQMRAEGVTFRAGVAVGTELRGEQLLHDFDAVVLAMGARAPRDLPIPGRELRGVHFAMEFLVQQNRRIAGDDVDPRAPILATGKNVVVIGGGDTGSDCVGTSFRQGAAQRHAARADAQAEPRSPSDQPVARVAAHPPHVELAGRGRRARLGRLDAPLPQRRWRGRRPRDGAGRDRGREDEVRRRDRVLDPCGARSARHGLRRAREGGRDRAARSRARRARQRPDRRERARRAFPACSRRATSRAGSRSSCGRSPTVVASRPAPTRGCAALRWRAPSENDHRSSITQAGSNRQGARRRQALTRRYLGLRPPLLWRLWRPGGFPDVRKSLRRVSRRARGPERGPALHRATGPRRARASPV